MIQARLSPTDGNGWISEPLDYQARSNQHYHPAQTHLASNPTHLKRIWTWTKKFPKPSKLLHTHTHTHTPTGNVCLNGPLFKMGHPLHIHNICNWGILWHLNKMKIQKVLFLGTPCSVCPRFAESVTIFLWLLCLQAAV